MIIQHNIMAMGAYRNYMGNTNSLSKNLEKLSSGYRINRAGDDAAGLAISEKMRAQITGLDAAQKNVQDGISLVQTAEGALQEVQDMLNRMTYLATQSANGTYDNEVDRANLQKEVEALSTEIDRIADSSNFNGINLLDGSMSTKSASTETVKISGADRMISDLMKKGEVPSEVAGTKTVLDSGKPSNGVKTKIEIDVNGLGGSIAGGNGTANELVLDFDIGGETFTTKIQGTTGTAGTQGAATVVSASKVATALYNMLKGSTDGGVTAGTAASVNINGVEYVATLDAANGKVALELQNLPLNKEECEGNLDVSVTRSDSSTVSSTLTGSNTVGSQVVTLGEMAGSPDRANTVFEITADDIRDGAYIKIGDKDVTLKVGAASTQTAIGGSTLVDLSDMEEGEIDLNAALTKISNGFGNAAITDANAKDAAGNAVTVNLKVGVSDGSTGHVTGLTIQRTDTEAANVYTSAEKVGALFEMKYTEKNEATKGLTLQIGDSAESYNQLSVDITDMHVKSLGLADIDIGTQEGAQVAVDLIKDAINQVSSVRGDLGATQNRLEHTANNLAVMEENIQDAESSIRDTDIAEEMMAYTKNNILIQSAQAMLAQANTVPQGVLQLLG